MDRQDRPSGLPSGSSLRTPSSRLPITRTPMSLKRSAAEASLSEDPTATRRALHTAQGRQTTLERKVVELERLVRKRDEDIEEQRREIGQLKQERGILLDGETREREALRQREEEWGAEKAKFVESLTHYRLKSRQATASAVEYESLYREANAKHSRLKSEVRDEIKLLEDRLREVEGERDGLRDWQRRAENLAIELDDLRRKQEHEAATKKDAQAEQRASGIVLEETRRQSQNLVTLQNQNDALQTEVNELRKWKKDADGKDSAAKLAERDLRDEVRSLNVELGRARNEIETLTQKFASSGDAEADRSTLEGRLSALSTLHEQVKAELSEQIKTNDQLHARLTDLASNSGGAAYSLTQQLEEANRELRWAKQGRQSAETREQLLKAELASYSAPTAGTDTKPSDAESKARIQQLQALVETYKAKLEDVSRDSRDAEERLAKGAGMAKASELAEAKAVIERLENELSDLEATAAEFSAAKASMEAEVAELMSRVWSGEFNPERERCLELKANPAAKIHAVRTEQLDKLKAENAALLDRLAEVDKEPSSSGSDARGLVPRISYDRLQQDNADLEAAHEKRLRRLKEIFGAKSREFLESVYSLLGWRIKFDENGADIRLTSMYAPKGKMGLTLKFTSNEGHFGTMAMMGGMARSLEEARDFWVTERQSIPGFLAQVTTEMFEKTTLGRAAGYVGLE